ncbi:MAG: SidA/IucD/PvdA family monooxygenase [Gammaproteobacteria bacterium]
MKSYDIVGIGAGPANLSLAALSTKIKDISAVFIEKRQEFVWHAGMLLPDAKLQVPFLNDLVTLADPTSPFSFLNFLSANKRLYQFIAANYNPLSRAEFNQYFQWIFNQLENINKGEEVLDVCFDGSLITVTTEKEKYQARNLVLGTGQAPYIPEMFKKHLGKNVYHNSQFMHRVDDLKKNRIAIIGGGQSGAEIFESLISDAENLPSDIFWISKRTNFLPLDDTAFTNEIFAPKFIKYFHGVAEDKKKYFIGEQKLANQGISECTARDVYQKLYELKFVKQREENFYLLPSHELVSITKVGEEYTLTIKDLISGHTRDTVVDKIILCTGYACEIPSALSNIQPMLKYHSNGLMIGKDYQLIWEGMDACSIYIQNGAQHTHGVSDSSLSVAAYRSATILNHITGRAVYPTIEDSSLVNWGWGSHFKS